MTGSRKLMDAARYAGLVLFFGGIALLSAWLAPQITDAELPRANVSYRVSPDRYPTEGGICDPRRRPSDTAGTARGGCLKLPQYRRGEDLDFTWTVQWVRACPGSINRDLRQLVIDRAAGSVSIGQWYRPGPQGVISTEAIISGSQDVKAEVLPLIREVRVTPMPIPRDAPLGPAAYRTVNTFACNWWQQWRPLVVEYPLVMFEIVP